MENIKCPHCGEIFTIDESGYAAIVSQIKDKEFNKQVAQNKKELEEKQESLIQNAVLKAKNESDNEIARLKEHIKDLETKGQIFSTQKNAEIQELKKEKEIAVKEAVRDCCAIAYMGPDAPDSGSCAYVHRPAHPLRQAPEQCPSFHLHRVDSSNALDDPDR